MIEDARQRGQQLGQWFAVPFTVAVGSFMWSSHIGFLLLILFFIYLGFSLPRMRKMQWRTKQLLCETAWARTQGYRPERLRLMTLPWSR